MMVIKECVIKNAPPILKVCGNNKSNPPTPKNKDSNCIPTRFIFALLYTKADSGFLIPPKE